MSLKRFKVTLVIRSFHYARKLNQYRHTLTSPLRQKPSQNQFRFEWVDNLKELQQVQRFRAAQFSHQFGLSFEDGLDPGPL